MGCAAQSPPPRRQPSALAAASARIRGCGSPARRHRCGQREKGGARGTQQSRCVPTRTKPQRADVLRAAQHCNCQDLLQRSLRPKCLGSILAFAAASVRACDERMTTSTSVKPGVNVQRCLCADAGATAQRSQSGEDGGGGRSARALGQCAVYQRRG